MKRQVAIMIGIASVSFLIGTMFNINFLALGGKPNSVWDAIYDLQAKLNSLNNTVIEQQTQISELQSKVDSLNASLETLLHGTNVTKITIIIEMTSSYIHMKFHGLSIEHVYTWTISNESIIDTFTYPEVHLTAINAERYYPSPRPEYIRFDIPLDVFISNETVEMRLRAGSYSSEAEYTSVNILDSQSNLICTFNKTVPPNWGFDETVYIPASAFFP